MQLTSDQLELIAIYSTDKLRGIYLPYLNVALEKRQINTPLRVSAFLAQIIHESMSFTCTEEIADGKAYEHREDLGNLRREALDAAHANHSTTGPFYKGHGLIQITGFDNHKSCGEALGIDLIRNPRLLCLPEYATDSAAWFWNKHGLNKLADVGLFGKITKAINGGYNGQKERLEIYMLAKKVLGC